MNKLVLILLLVSATSVFAYDSGIAIQSVKGASILVTVNGKRYNEQPGKVVRVRSSPGLFHLEVRVLNPWNKQWYLVRKDIRTERGFEFQYRVVFQNKEKPMLVEVKKYPIYSRYFLNTALYNRYPTA